MSHSPSIWRQGPLYRGTAACEETEHGLVLTNWHRILLVVVVAEQAASTRQNCWQMHFVDLTRTTLFLRPTERIKGVNGRHQDPPLAPSRPTATTDIARPLASRAEASEVLDSALRPPQPPCNLTGTIGYDKPPHFLAQRQPPACFRPRGEISAFF